MGYFYYVEGITAGAPAPFENVQADGYWSATEFVPAPGDAYSFDTSTGEENPRDELTPLYAVAVRPGDVATTARPTPVPVPPTLALAVLALGAGLVASRSRRPAPKHA